MFHRMSIRLKLLFIIAMMMLIVGLVASLGVYNANKANEALERVYFGKVLPVSYVYDMVTSFYPVNRDIQATVNGELDMLSLQSNLEAAKKNLDEKWKKYLPSLQEDLKPKENVAKDSVSEGQKAKFDREQRIRELSAELNSAMPSALKAIEQTMALAAAKDQVALQKYATDEAMFAIGDAFGILPDLIQAKLEQVADTYTEADLEYHRNKNLVILMSLVGTMAALLLSLVVTRGINLSIRRVDSKLRELASGEADLTQRIAVTTRDEIGALSENFNQLMTNLEELVKQVKRSGIQVTTSSTHIAAGTKQLEATVTEQAASTNEAVAGAKEISATAQQLLATMNQVASMSEDTAEAASKGREDLGQMASTMKLIDDAARLVSERLAAINEKAVSISAVVTTINKVADQTNLLSLNAAIEAEKAGEYGQGFAVVAREIRRLADQTAVATLDIEKTVKEMKNAVSSGVMSMDKFKDQIRQAVSTVGSVGTQLAEIIEHVQTLNPRFEAVVHGMEAQAKGASQISDAMLQIGEASQQTAQNLRETNQSIGELNDATRGLQREFSRFKVS